MYKKILAGLLAVALVCGSAAVLPAAEMTNGGVISASAETDNKKRTENGQWVYWELSDGTLGVYPVDTYCFENPGYSKILEIPAEIDGKRVTYFTINLGYVTPYEKIIFPETIVKIDEGPCYWWKRSGIKSIEVSENNPNFSSYGGALYNKEQTELIWFPTDKKDMVFAPTLKKIGYFAFAHYGKDNGVARIMIPSSVTEFDELPFGEYFGEPKTSYEGQKLMLYCYPNTAGEQYAKDNGFDYTLITDDYEYDVLDDNTVEITKYIGDKTDVTIPSEIDGKKVTSIGTGAFREYSIESSKGITSITIPEGIESIGSEAFRYCSKLTELVLPDSIEFIGSYAFANCTGLKSVKLPARDIETFNTFTGCTSLTSITIPYGVTKINDDEFSGCSSLSEVIIPDSVKEIKTYAFAYCDSLKSIIIPASVTTIGDKALGYGMGNSLARGGNIFKNEDFHIYCYANTAGEQYAKDNEFDYTLIGDISGDGELTTADVGKINAAVRGTKPITDETQKMLADLNGDGKITTADVGELNAYVRGTLTKW